MVKSQIAKFMEESFLFQFDSDVTETTDLFKAGIIDSYGYIQLMRFIQSTFQITFSKEEILSNVITSLSELVTVVEAKQD